MLCWLLVQQIQFLSANEAVCEADGTCSVATDTDTAIATTDIDDKEAHVADAEEEEEEEALAVKSECYGTKQYITQDNRKAEQLELMKQVDTYMHETVFKEHRFVPIKDACINQHELCSFWATIGECQANAAYMLTSCAPACQGCNFLIFEERCPLDPELMTDNNVWKEGDLTSFFTKITTDPFYVNAYSPTILSQPTRGGVRGDTPWVVTLENFLSESECLAMIELGAEQGYKRSEDVGSKKVDGTYDSVQSEGRTSTNAWCMEACYTNNITQGILQRIENLTGIPDSHSEYLQLLKYEEGQFYESHHDFIDHHIKRAQGPRILVSICYREVCVNRVLLRTRRYVSYTILTILDDSHMFSLSLSLLYILYMQTVFLYLNDVEQGGGTRFTDIDLIVLPKRGRVVIWPSVLDAFVTQIEPKTHHEAMAVEKGIKYGANAWVRERGKI